MDEKTSLLQDVALLDVSDEPRMVSEVVCALLSTGRFSSCQLHVSATGGVITLRGRVASYCQKQAAQVAALAVIGLRQLRNEVDAI